jgi:hypothetical protein
LKFIFQFSIQLLLILIITIPIGVKVFSASPVYTMLKNILVGNLYEIGDDFRGREKTESELREGIERRRMESVRRRTVGSVEIREGVKEVIWSCDEAGGEVKEDVRENAKEGDGKKRVGDENKKVLEDKNQL